jgi:hypothetical protein
MHSVSQHFFAHPNSNQAWFAAASGLALAVAAYYEHFRRKEQAQGVGLMLAALGLFFWAGFQWPAYDLLIIAAVAVGVPWLIWSERARHLRRATLSALPFEVKRRPPLQPRPSGERGWLDFRRDGGRALARMVAVTTDMAKDMQKSARQMNGHTRRTQAAMGGSSDRQWKVAAAAAKDINRHAATTEIREAEYRAAQQDMAANFDALLKAQPQTDLGDLKEAAAAAREGLESLREYRKAVLGLRKQSMSQTLNEATDRLLTVLDKQIENIAATQKFLRDKARRGPRRQP